MTGNTFNSTKQPTVAAIGQSVADSTAFLINPVTPPNLPAAGFAGSTVGNVLSSGGRFATTYGELDDLSLTTGLDARVIQQRIGEFYTVNPLLNGPPIVSGSPPMVQNLVSNVPGVNIFETGLPQALMVNPGAFAEMTLPWTSYFKSRIGARGDYVHTNDLGSTLGSPADPATNLPPEIPHTSQSKDDGLWACYMANTLEIDRNWTGNFSFGQAQRAPSLIDRYADRLFLGIMQSGYSRVIGDPNLQKERNWQIDLALNARYDLWRGNIRGFQSWVNNYITYAALPVQIGGVFGPGVPPGSTSFPGVVNNADPTSSRLLYTVNTHLATLSGFETYHEFGEVSNWIKPFAAVNYVYGVDQQIHQALPMIPPLQSRLGFNFQRAGGNSPWGFTAYARCVARQNRDGIVRNFVPGAPLVQIEERTPGFTTAHIQGYWSPRGTRFTLFAGIDNVFNRSYIEHLSLRTNPVLVYSPGFSPYMNMEWTY
jgi:iron complex outermembrane receptor protein